MWKENGYSGAFGVVDWLGPAFKLPALLAGALKPKRHTYSIFMILLSRFVTSSAATSSSLHSLSESIGSESLSSIVSQCSSQLSSSSKVASSSLSFSSCSPPFSTAACTPISSLVSLISWMTTPACAMLLPSLNASGCCCG